MSEHVVKLEFQLKNRNGALGHLVLEMAYRWHCAKSGGKHSSIGRIDSSFTLSSLKMIRIRVRSNCRRLGALRISLLHVLCFGGFDFVSAFDKLH